MSKEIFKQAFDENLHIDQSEIYDNIMEKIKEEKTQTVKRQKWKPVLATCCAVFVLICGFSGYSIIVEANEYKEAVLFFEEYDLPIEGLSRKDIKAVYKDITLKKFSYDKTIEIMNEISVELYCVELEKTDKNELEKLWNYRNFIIDKTDRKDIGTHYEIDSNYGAAVIKKYDNGELLWSYQADENFIINENNNIFEYENGIIVAGGTYHGKNMYGTILNLDNDGNLVWKTEDADKRPMLYQAVLVDDNEIVVFGNRTEGKRNNWNVFFTFKI